MKKLKEIEINNSKLKLVSYQYTPGEELVNKDNLRYHIAISLSGQSVTAIKNIAVSGEYWFIENSSKSFGDNIYYDKVDFKELVLIIKCLTKYFLYNNNNLEVLEKLILSTKDDAIISKFYDIYGKNDIKDYALLLDNIVNTDNYKQTPCKDTYNNIYTRERNYSVYRLLDELSLEKAEILLDPSLIGDYNAVSKKKVDRRKDNEIQYREWSKIYGLTRNKTRANISISYTGKALVQVPNNPYNIVPGEREVSVKKSICIIRDGRLNQDKIGIRASSKLISKLKKLGVAEPLLYKNECLINLSKLPVISKKDIKLVSSYYMAKIEASYIVAKVVTEYLDLFYPEKTITTNYSSIEEKQKDEFLRSIGIVGDFYVPNKADLINQDSYTTVELITYIDSNIIPQVASKRYSLYRVYKNNGACKNSSINSILRHVDFTGDIDKLRKYWKERLDKFAEEIRKRKFQIIMSKVTKFSDNIFIEDAYKRITDISTNVDFRISWKFNKKTINL